VNDQDSVFKATQASESASTQGNRRHEASASVAGTVLAVPSIAAAWDPYEVWLTRVKRPRDLRVGPSQA
jgi:hypothetical protein